MSIDKNDRGVNSKTSKIIGFVLMLFVIIILFLVFNKGDHPELINKNVKGTTTALQHDKWEIKKAEVESLMGKNLVYWVKSDKFYHLYSDCSKINKDETEIFSGTIKQARELNGLTKLCKVCKKRFENKKSNKK